MSQQATAVIQDFAWKVGCVLFWLLVPVLLCVPWLLAQFTRRLLIISRQFLAKRTLAAEQKNLLSQLWQAEKEHRQYVNAYHNGCNNLAKAEGAAKDRAYDLWVECGQATIDDWRMAAFTLDAYDYSWWIYLQFQWWE